VPMWPEVTSQSVEGIWQGLKRFEHEDNVDLSRFQNSSMRGIKRTSQGFGRHRLRRGRVLGHQYGKLENVLLDYLQARALIYLPSYLWVLENVLQEEIGSLRQLAANQPVVLLDYETNCDVYCLERPLSHAGLVLAYIEGVWPRPVVEQPKLPG
jgi:uncharacterized protein DUF6939